MAKLKEDILKNVSNGGSSSSSNSTNGGINTTNDSTATTTTITNYIHGVGAIVVLSLGVCIFIIPKLMTNQTTSQPDKDPEKISKIRRKKL